MNELAKFQLAVYLYQRDRYLVFAYTMIRVRVRLKKYEVFWKSEIYFMVSNHKVFLKQQYY